MSVAFPVLREDFCYALSYNGIFVGTLLCFNEIVIGAFGDARNFK